MRVGRRWTLAILILAAGAGAESDWFADYHRARQIYDRNEDPQSLHLALALTERALDKRPPERRVGEVQFLRGCLAYDLREPSTAVAALRAATQADPESTRFRLWLAYAYELDGRTTLAVRCLRWVYEHPNATAEERQSARDWLNSLHEPPELAEREPAYTLIVPGALVRFHKGEPFAASVRAALVAARQRLINDLGIEVADPVEVVLFANESEYRAYHEYRNLPRPEWSTACAVNGRIFTYPAAGEEDGLLATVTHEYTHIALRAYADDRPLPCWLDEGLAVLVSGQFPTYREDIKRSRELLSLDALMVQSFSVYDRHYAYLAYAQSKAMSEDLLRLYGAGRLRAFLRGLARGQDTATAFEQAFGTSLPAYHRWWVRERPDGS